MTTKQKLLSAVIVFLVALAAALATLSSSLTQILPELGAAGTPAVVAGRSGAGSSGAAGVSVSKAGAGGSAGRSGAGGTGGLPSANGAGRGGQAAPKPGSFSVGIQTWFVDPTWTGEKLFSSPGVFSPQFLDQLRPFSTIRHMDDNAINCSKQSSWSTRRLPSDPNQIAYGAADGSGDPGIAIEYQIDMCNQTGNDCWFNVPHLATDDYVSQFANLVKSRLAAGLQSYWEYSNETWNGQFCQFGYVNQQGAALKLPGANQYYQGQAYTVYRLLQIGAIVKGALPNAKLVYAFSGNYDLAAQALKQPGVAGKIDMVAIAPYVDGDPYSLASFKSKVDSLTNGGTDSVQSARRIADSAGISILGCYEAGGSYYQNAQSYAQSTDSGQAYTYYLDKLNALMNGPCNLYAHASIWNSSTAWGLYDAKGTKSARATAVEAWIAAH